MVPFIPFFGFSSLLSMRLWKYYIIFVYILQGKIGKTEKNGKKIAQLKWQKHQKPKGINMGWTKQKARKVCMTNVMLLIHKTYIQISFTYNLVIQFVTKNLYRTRAIITRSWFEKVLEFKPWIFSPDFLVLWLVHKLSAILTTLDYKSHWRRG